SGSQLVPFIKIGLPFTQNVREPSGVSVWEVISLIPNFTEMESRIFPDLSFTLKLRSYNSCDPLLMGHHRRGFLITNWGYSSGVKSTSCCCPLINRTCFSKVIFSFLSSPSTVTS